jgi:hypothetical protein
MLNYTYIGVCIFILLVVSFFTSSNFIQNKTGKKLSERMQVSIILGVSAVLFIGQFLFNETGEIEVGSTFHEETFTASGDIYEEEEFYIITRTSKPFAQEKYMVLIEYSDNGGTTFIESDSYKLNAKNPETNMWSMPYSVRNDGTYHIMILNEGKKVAEKTFEVLE